MTDYSATALVTAKQGHQINGGSCSAVRPLSHEVIMIELSLKIRISYKQLQQIIALLLMLLR